jgi:hypothetical protein
MGSSVRRVKRECVPGGELNLTEARDDVPNCISFVPDDSPRT